MAALKHLTGEGSATTQAPATDALELLTDVGGYPRWYGSVVRSGRLDVPPSGGNPGRGSIEVVVSAGPLKRSFPFDVEIFRDSPEVVRLRRIPSDGSDRETFTVTWTVTGGAPARLSVRLDAHLEVPPFVPVGALGGTLAGGLARAAAAELDRR